MHAVVRVAFLLTLYWLYSVAAAQQGDNGFPLTPAGGDMLTVQVVDPRLRDQDGGQVVYNIRVFQWLPEQPNGMTILYNHGFQSHSAWFFATAELLKEKGYAIYAFDRIGSGQSDPGAGRSMGRFFAAPGHISHWRLFVQTLDMVAAWVAEKRPGDSLIIWANSYGAKILTAWLHDLEEQNKENLVSAAIFTTPGIYQNKETMPLPFSTVRLLLSGTQARFSLPMVDRDGDNGASWFIGPGQWFEAIRYDRLSLRDVSKRFYIQTALMDRYIAKRRNDRYYVPAFYLLVRGDELMDNDEMEQDVLDRAENGFFKYYSGGPDHKHFLMFTEDRGEVLDDIDKFVVGRRGEIFGLRNRSGQADD